MSEDISDANSSAAVSPIVLLGGGALLFWLMARQLLLPLWFDEIYTLGQYASRPLMEIVTDYSEPNNHIGYSLLLHFLSGISPDPLIHRFPSFVFGVGTLWVVFSLVRSLSNERTALFATMLTGSNQVYLNFATQVRGYCLSMLLFTVLVKLTISDESSTRLRNTIIVLLGAYLIYVIPTNIFFLVSLALSNAFADVTRQGLRAAVRPFCALIGAAGLGCLLYLPVINQIRGASSTAAGTFEVTRLIAVASTYFSSVLYDAPTKLAAISMPFFVWHTLRRLQSSERQQTQYLLVVAGAVVCPFLFAALAGVVPYERNFLPVLPVLLALAGWSFHALICAVGRYLKLRSLASGLAFAVIGWQVAFNHTFPERLRQAQLDSVPQTPYFLYTGAGFDPGAVVETVSESARKREFFACVMTEIAWQNLGHEFSSFNLPTQLVRSEGTEKYVDVIYFISMMPDAEVDFQERTDLPTEVIEAMEHRKFIGGFFLSEVRADIRLPKKLLIESTKR